LKKSYVLDACALIALINNEPGSDKIGGLMREAAYQDITLNMNQVNLLEVYFYIVKTYGQDKADEILSDMDTYPINLITELSKDVIKETGRLKATYNMSMGDSIAAAESMVGNGTLVTSDHKDFGQAEQAGKVKVLWFR
jgi:PIN domain nuclease of toxin-antitoxin system